MSKKNIAVIGRIPGDDEDSCYIFPVENAAEAMELFEQAIYEDAAEDPEQIEKDYGAKVYHTHLLRSDSEIEPWPPSP